MTDAIIDVAARALQDSGDEAIRAVDAQFYAAVVIDAVTPLIEDAYARKLDAAEEIARKGNDYTKGWKLLEDDGSVTTLGTSDAIEAAARALRDNPGTAFQTYQELAEIAVAAVTPLIEAAALKRRALEIRAPLEDILERVVADALERAAKVAEDYRKTSPVSDVIAEDIRALKEQP